MDYQVYRARKILRSMPEIWGLSEGQFKIIEETNHPFWEKALEEAKVQFSLESAIFSDSKFKERTQV